VSGPILNEYSRIFMKGSKEIKSISVRITDSRGHESILWPPDCEVSHEVKLRYTYSNF
jgi:hypothetical protein